MRQPSSHQTTFEQSPYPRETMSEHDAVGDALERLEWRDKRSGSISKAAQLTRRTALTGGAAGLAAVLLEACGSSGGTGTATAQAAVGLDSGGVDLRRKGGYRFTFVNHATRTPSSPRPSTASRTSASCSTARTSGPARTRATSARWRLAINAAVSAGVDGIATSLVSTALAKPVDAAMRAGIPVISYNADVSNTSRLAYIGQDLVRSGQEMGREIRAPAPRRGHGS